MAGDSNIHSTAPDAYVVAFPYETETTKVGQKWSQTDMKTRAPVIIDKDILSIQTSKGKGGAGTFRISLGSSQNYKAMLHTGCWLFIYMNDVNYDDGSKRSTKNASDSGLKMIGTIRSLRVNEGTSPDGTRYIRYDIAGDDYHSALETKAYINILFQAKGKDNSDTSLYYIFKEYFKDTKKIHTPSEMVSIILKAMLNKEVGASSTPSKHIKDASPVMGGTIGIPTSVAERAGRGSKKSLYEFLEVDIQSTIGQMTVSSSVGDEFSCWSLIRQFCNPLLNEVYTDLVDDGSGIVPSFVMRPIPFANLKSVKSSKKIKEHEIVNLNYGKGDGERFNMFLIFPTQAQSIGMVTGDFLNELSGEKSLQETTDSTSVGRYGLRPFISRSPYMAHSLDDCRNTNEEVRKMWGPAHLYENGQVTIVGAHEQVSVGSNIEFYERGWIAHVESVSHHYAVHGEGEKSYFTTITFVRLQTKDGSPIDLVEDSGQTDFDRGVTHSEGGER